MEKLIIKLFLFFINKSARKKTNKILAYYDLQDKNKANTEYHLVKYVNKLTVLHLLDEDMEFFITEYIEKGKKYTETEIFNTIK